MTAAGGGCMLLYFCSTLACGLPSYLHRRYQKHFYPKLLVPLIFAPCVVLTSEVAVVGRYHQQLSLGVLDNVTPMDGVRMAEEFVLVNIYPPIQYLCTKEREKKRKK